MVDRPLRRAMAKQISASADIILGIERGALDPPSSAAFRIPNSIWFLALILHVTADRVSLMP
jgi:hypothetical protein